MECFPACRVCTGLCTKEVPVTRKPARRSVSTPRQVGMQDPLILLTCDHYTSNAEQTLISVFFDVKPKRGSYWCEPCGTWREKQRFKKPLPEEPPF